jgi:cbb3-type cytochrome oxidase maturation protein
VSVLFLVLPLALAFSAAAVVAFLWSTKTGQLDDLETPPLRMLRDPARASAGRSPPARSDAD